MPDFEAAFWQLRDEEEALAPLTDWRSTLECESQAIIDRGPDRCSTSRIKVHEDGVDVA